MLHNEYIQHGTHVSRKVCVYGTAVYHTTMHIRKSNADAYIFTMLPVTIVYPVMLCHIIYISYKFM